jgi:hypothetical protein
VTGPTGGLYHYEYAVYNQTLDRAIQSFSVPTGAGINVSNVGFHAPPQEPGWANDGTFNNLGYSSTPWTPTQTASAISWSSETLAQNQNANAIRWGTMYNFRFDADQPPQTASATVGFYKTGAPIMVTVKVPTPPALPTPSQVVSRMLHAGVPFDVNLPLTGTAGVECRSGGGTNDYQVVFTFPGNVTFTSAAVTAGTGSVSSSSGSGTTTVTVNLTGITNAQRITVTLSAVNNGSATADVSVPMGVLVGDSNGDGTVNSADIGQAKSQSGNTVDASNFRQDVNLDGNINASDIGLVKSKSGTALP